MPGNVRELRNALERVMILERSQEITPAMLPMYRDGHSQDLLRPAQPVLKLPPDLMQLEEMERQLIQEALRRAGGNQTRAARTLGIGRDALRYRMRKLGLLGELGVEDPK